MTKVVAVACDADAVSETERGEGLTCQPGQSELLLPLTGEQSASLDAANEVRPGLRGEDDGALRGLAVSNRYLTISQRCYRHAVSIIREGANAILCTIWIALIE